MKNWWKTRQRGHLTFKGHVNLFRYLTIVFQPFLSNKTNNCLHISASNKLKDCDVKDKTKYSDRKKLGISKCLEIITTDFRFNEHQFYDQSDDPFNRNSLFMEALKIEEAIY